MYKHILIPIDDSKLAEKAIKNGVALARSMKARVTGFVAMPEYRLPTEADVVARRIIGPDEHNKRCAKKAATILGKLERRAAAAGVKCATQYSLDDRPDEAIAKAATKNGCDLILMASHGRT